MFARKLPAVESLCIYDATWQVGPNQSSVFVHLESFTSITELADEEDSFLVVLIGRISFGDLTSSINLKYLLDEVESLTAARAGAMAGTEPSDGLRVCKFVSFL